MMPKELTNIVQEMPRVEEPTPSPPPEETKKLLFPELLSLLEEMAPGEQENLAQRLCPLLKARRDFFHHLHVQIPHDLAARQKIQEKRLPLLNRLKTLNAKEQEQLAKLNDKFAAINLQIEGEVRDGWRVSGHVHERDRLDKLRASCRKAFSKY